jgi:hypothetical protein
VGISKTGISRTTIGSTDKTNGQIHAQRAAQQAGIAVANALPRTYDLYEVAISKIDPAARNDPRATRHAKYEQKCLWPK